MKRGLNRALGRRTATKTDPAKWEAAKREARSRMGGKHSARAMQLATRIYKSRGGGYRGSRPSGSNSLRRWSRQNWRWSGGSRGRGVYLPERKVERLRSTPEGRRRLARAGRVKSAATREGRQYSRHGLAAGTSGRRR